MTKKLSESEKIIADLMGLKHNPGWQLLVSILEDNVKNITNRLVVGNDNDTLDAIKRLRDKRSIYQNLIDEPDRLIKIYSKGSETIVLDPYEKSTNVKNDDDKKDK